MHYNYVKGSVKDRFWAKVEKTATCWIWLASKDSKGYGWFGIDKGNVLRAHRFSWELHNGEIPKYQKGKRDTLFVCHKCDNPSCVRPEHLFLGTNADNMRDMVLKHRSPSNKHELNPNARLTLKQVKSIRNRYKNGKRGIVKKLTNEYKVNRNTIRRIVHNYLWI